MRHRELAHRSIVLRITPDLRSYLFLLMRAIERHVRQEAPSQNQHYSLMIYSSNENGRGYHFVKEVRMQ